MAIFWLWAVRNLFVVLAGLAILAGYVEAADWSIALATALGLAFVAEFGSRMGRRALSKKRRKAAAREAIRSATDLRERLRTQEQQHRQRAA